MAYEKGSGCSFFDLSSTFLKPYDNLELTLIFSKPYINLERFFTKPYDNLEPLYYLALFQRLLFLFFFITSSDFFIMKASIIPIIIKDKPLISIIGDVVAVSTIGASPDTIA